MKDLAEITRDLIAERRAVRSYSERCGELFELADLERACGDPVKAIEYHRAATIVGHAAWAEDRDPEPA